VPQEASGRTRAGHLTHLAGLAVAQLANARASVSLAQHVGMAAGVAGLAQKGSVLDAEHQRRALAHLARWRRAHAAVKVAKLDTDTVTVAPGRCLRC
jgi:hypothetical protein